MTSCDVCLEDASLSIPVRVIEISTGWSIFGVVICRSCQALPGVSRMLAVIGERMEMCKGVLRRVAEVRELEALWSEQAEVTGD